MLKCQVGLNFASFIQPNNDSVVGFTRHPAVVFIFGGGNPRRAKQRQTGEEVEKCHQPQHGTKCCARGGFHQRWQGVGHHDFNHFKTNSSQKCSANQGFLRGRWRGNRQKIQKKSR